MKKPALLLAGSVLVLSSCAGVKSSFDCDATTSDTCMTMTKANQLARNKTAKQVGKQAVGGLPSLVNLPTNATSAPRSVVTAPSGVGGTHPRSGVSAGSVSGIKTNTPTSTLTPRPICGPRRMLSPDW